MGEVRKVSFVPVKCECCTAPLKISTNKIAKCEYCGTVYLIEKEAPRNENEWLQDKLDDKKYEESPRNIPYDDSGVLPQQHKSGFEKFLLIIAWIYFFPIMLTIHILGEKKLNAVLRYIIVAIIWLLIIVGICKFFSGLFGSTNDKPAETAVQSQSEQQEIRNGYDEKTNTTISVGTASFSIPKYFHYRPSSQETADKYYYVEDDSSIAFIMTSISENIQYDGDLDAAMHNYTTNMESSTGNQIIEVLASEKYSVNGHHAFLVGFSLKDGTSIYWGEHFVIIDEANNTLISIGLLEDDTCKFTYLNDFEKVISSARMT